MSYNKFMMGSPVLMGDNRIPGVSIPEDLKKLLPEIFRKVSEFGCDFPPTVVEMLTYDEISEIAAYGGFPVRYPHWKWGMEYEELQRGYMYGMHRIYEMVVNCCFSATQVVTREAGSKKIKDVSVGEHVLSAKGWRRVLLVKKQDKSKTLCLNLHEFFPKTICTPNHKWKCLRNGHPTWIKAKDIVSGDVIMAGGRYEDFLGKPAAIDWSSDKVVNETANNIKHRLKSISPPSEMTLELAELLGVASGDGTVGTQRVSNLISVCVRKPLEDYKIHIMGLFEKVFKVKPKLHIKKKSVDNIVFCSKMAVDYFDTIGFKKGSTYKSKRVPWSIWRSSNEYRAAYLRGFFDTDGYCGKYLSVSCFSDDLASDIQLLLLEMGIRSKYKRVQNKNNDIAVLTIKGKRNIRLFQKLVGFSLEYKTNRLAKLCEISSAIGHGQKMEGFIERIFDLIDTVDLQPDWMYRFRRCSKELTSNAYWNFLERCVASGYSQFDELLDVAQTPLYEVKSIDEDEIQETYDIALDHDDHDFLANGLVSHNTNPCYLYCLDSNSLLDNVTVIAHALGHADFFKNNIYFSQTSQNMMNELANHGTRIRRYMSRWGKERVTEFIDYVLRIETLIDPAKAWVPKRYKDNIPKDSRKYRQPSRLKVEDGHDYMEEYVNTEEWIRKQHEDIEKVEAAEYLDLFVGSTKDIMGFIRDNAPLKPWESDIVSMLYEESMYFAPQRMTKMLNEGHASWVDYNIIAKEGLSGLGQEHDSGGIIEYAKHKMGVLGGKYSMNPYKLGFNILCDIEERWDKGRFGSEWEECTDSKKKEDWDLKLGLGKEKVFEVRKLYNDVTAIMEFFTPEFCEKYEFFEWKKYPNGEYKIESRDPVKIKNKLVNRYMNGGLPDIRLTDCNHRGEGSLFLQHAWSGRILHDSYVAPVLEAMRKLWKKDVYLATRSQEGQERVYRCRGDRCLVDVVTREDYERDDF